jgi:preprotein translocase subunit SecD
MRNLLIKYLTLSLSFFPCMALADGMTFQIVQSQYVFDYGDVENASLVKDRGRFVGLQIELKGQAAKSFAEMTAENVGKRINVVFQGHIVSSGVLETPLKGNILVSGITEGDAEKFLEQLTNLKAIDRLRNPH